MPHCLAAAGSLVEAVAQHKEPSPRPSAAAGPPLSRLASRSASAIPTGSAACNSPLGQSPSGRPRAVTEGPLQTAGFSGMRPLSVSLQPQQLDSSREHLSTFGGEDLDNSRALGSSHSATTAARLARQASARSTAEHTAGDADPEMLWQEQQHPRELAAQLAAANAELVSALATARQVLADLVLGSEPEAAAAAQVQDWLLSFGLDEALSEIVHQVGL